MKSRILVVDDERNLRETLSEILSQDGHTVFQAENPEQALMHVISDTPDMVFCDWKMPEGDGSTFLHELGRRDLLRKMPVIIITAHGTSNNTIEAMQLGAYDFVTKPFDLDEICSSARRALQHAQLQKEVEELRSRLSAPESATQETIVGSCRPMLEIFKAVGRVAKTDAAVLILGESGTGKELIARAIHQNSQRRDRPFVVVNCAALPSELLESELFGHEKGAFTGAVARKVGRFEAADGGTVFLDEIGELAIHLQPKLLRVLQEHSFERLGGSETINADFRVIAATNRDLQKASEDGDFRQDLYFRLSAFAIALPPLRARRSDIVPLAEYFLARSSERNAIKSTGFAEDAILALHQYSFPGNVRELEHIVERALLLSGGRVIAAEHLTFLQTTTINGNGDLHRLMDLPFHESVVEWEKYRITRALNHSGGNKAEAARHLGIHRRLLYDKVKQFGLED